MVWLHGPSAEALQGALRGLPPDGGRRRDPPRVLPARDATGRRSSPATTCRRSCAGPRRWTGCACTRSCARTTGTCSPRTSGERCSASTGSRRARSRASRRTPSPRSRLNDYEWILALEADELHELVDLMRHLRATEARRHVREEIPFYTGRRVTPPGRSRCSVDVVRRAAAGLVRRSRGARRGDAVPGEVTARAAASRASGSRRSPTTTSRWAASARSTPRTARCSRRSARSSTGGASTSRSAWGNRNSVPFLADALRGSTRRARGGSSRRDRARIPRTRAAASTARTSRARSTRPGSTRPRDGPGPPYVRPPRVRRAVRRRRRDGARAVRLLRRARSTASPARTTHSIPTSMAEASGPPGAYPRAAVARTSRSTRRRSRRSLAGVRGAVWRRRRRASSTSPGAARRRSRGWSRTSTTRSATRRATAPRR